MRFMFLISGRHLRPLVLLSFVLLLYWRMFSYPYIQDDWHQIYYFWSTEDHMHFADYFTSFFFSPGENFYRPLAKLYFYLIIHLFGDHAIGFRILDLATVFSSAIVLKAIAFRLFKHEALSWITAAWFVFSGTVLMDPLMWMCGMYDLGGVLFFLLSILFFMKRKTWLSALSYLVAILFKEGPLLLPFVLFLYMLLQERKLGFIWKTVIPAVRAILPHILVVLLYSFLRYEAALPGVDPTRAYAYEVDFWGIHLL